MQPSKRVFDHTQVASSDRSFNYGDGCFTTMRASAGKIQLLNTHIQRLQSDADVLGIDFSFKDELLDYLTGESFTQALQLKNESVVKVLVSRGTGGRGYMPPTGDKQNSQCFVSVHPFKSQENAALSLMLSPVLLAKQPYLAGVKHCNRLEQVLAKRSLWQYNAEIESKFDDVLMLDNEQHVIESSSANFFAFDGKHWLTPKLDLCGVTGVMRQFIIDNSEALSMQVHECVMSVEQLSQLKSAFVCNAVHGVTPVKSIFNGAQSFSFDTNVVLDIDKTLTSLLLSGN
ncbi:aminodeoxychorismate lyase [Glaciecola sp. KUL10]|uniref:aminodeoxychorismate lyase n=1 Tax=Glaciecola sp. (strain KUL10) TaxID=2161813 RepID=UPI000D782EE5|nr:aminodeoxychorismate lyase [Glaciecola sp. KUL10]GBL03032.1 4-amino-4-deoxychorismate lyase [Glaciecola sp. KUL10]